MVLAGWSNVYVPDAVVVHRVGASRGKVANRVILERHRGMIHYFHKHHPAHPLVRALADGFILARAGVLMAANTLRR
jgi:GT2 family glycosyltransferase